MTWTAEQGMETARRCDRYRRWRRAILLERMGGTEAIVAGQVDYEAAMLALAAMDGPCLQRRHKAELDDIADDIRDLHRGPT